MTNITCNTWTGQPHVRRKLEDSKLGLIPRGNPKLESLIYHDFFGFWGIFVGAQREQTTWRTALPALPAPAFSIYPFSFPKVYNLDKLLSITELLTQKEKNNI